MASGKNAISLDIHRTCKPEEVLPTKQTKLLRRQRGPPRRKSHNTHFKERYFR